MYFMTEVGMLDNIINEDVAEVVEDPSLIQKWFEKAAPAGINFLIQVLIAIVILLIGLKVISFVMKLVLRSFERGHVDKGVASFLTSLIKYMLYFILVMILLGRFGVTAGSVVALLGSAGLTIGLAMQGSLSNFAGGVLIMLLKPFVVGDYIITSEGEGSVIAITIFYTKLVTVDNKAIMIPNGTLSNINITNVSHMDTRRVDVQVGVEYDADLAQTKAVLHKVADLQELVLHEEPIDVFVAELADSSVVMELRVWVKNEDYWNAKWHLTEEIKNALDENGIGIAYPHLHVIAEKSASNKN